MSDKNKNFDMRGYIAKNSKKSKPSQPDWQGKIRVDGKEFWLAAWFKDDSDELMTVSVTDPEKFQKKVSKEGEQDRPQKEQSTQNTSSSSSSDSSDSNSEDPFGDIFSSLP